MRVLVQLGRAAPSPRLAHDFAILYTDNWDDFGFKTTFTLELHIGPQAQARPINLGYVKILQLGLGTSGRVVLPEKDFEQLPEDFCSLGQTLSFYETLLGVDSNIATSVLRSLRDVVFDPRIRVIFEKEIGFKRSLLRESSALRALEDAPAVLFGTSASPSELKAGELNFDFVTTVGGNRFSTNFRFGDEPVLPTRINAVIGYNGCGKTQLLANLAMVASLSPEDRKATRIRDAYGIIFGKEGYEFGATIAVSYSAFDTFELPCSERNEEPAAQKHHRVEEQGGFFNYYYYYYYGLRMQEATDNSFSDHY